MAAAYLGEQAATNTPGSNYYAPAGANAPSQEQEPEQPPAAPFAAPTTLVQLVAQVYAENTATAHGLSSASTRPLITLDAGTD